MKGGIYKTRYGYNVRFGRKLTKHFKHLIDAERFLNYIRHQTDIGKFDLRDWQRNSPLQFDNLAEKWIQNKSKQVKHKTLVGYKRVMKIAVRRWKNQNIKDITSGQIEDFIFERDMASKSRNDMRVILKDFWSWVCRREDQVQMPTFPKTSFELGWRNIIDIQTQSLIINEIRKISFNINPRIWIGIKWLSTYISIRPGELVEIKEGEINIHSGIVVIPHPKEKKPKIVYLLDDDIEILSNLPKGFPDLPFFRHTRNITSVKAGQKFGESYLRKWWKRACENLGIEGIDLYGGTRHSTVTALGKICTPEEVKTATGHVSPAFERYFQGKASRARAVTEKIKSQQHLNNGLLSEKNGNLLKFEG